MLDLPLEYAIKRDLADKAQTLAGIRKLQDENARLRRIIRDCEQRFRDIADKLDAMSATVEKLRKL